MTYIRKLVVVFLLLMVFTLLEACSSVSKSAESSNTSVNGRLAAETASNTAAGKNRIQIGNKSPGFSVYRLDNRTHEIAVKEEASTSDEVNFKIVFNVDKDQTTAEKAIDNSANEFTVQSGVYNACAEEVQSYLSALNLLDPVHVNGYWESFSKGTMNDFQRVHGLRVTDYPNQATLKALNAAFRSQIIVNTPVHGSFSLDYTGFIYGNLSNVDNQNSITYSIQELSKLPYIVCSQPGELSAKSNIVADSIKSTTKMFGYVNIGPDNPYDPQSEWELADLNKVKAEIDNIAASGWYGVFIDQYGYDYRNTREIQNEIVDYAHGKGLKCFANAWDVDDALEGNTHLGQGDWYLCESFFRSGSQYRSSSGDVRKWIKAMGYANCTGVEIAGLTCKDDYQTFARSSDDIAMSNILSKALGFDGWWFCDAALESNNVEYGQDSNIDIGSSFTSYLHQDTGNKYVARTNKYTIAFYAGTSPSMILNPVNAGDPVITLGNTQYAGQIDPDFMTGGEQMLLQHRINDYGFKDGNGHALDEDGHFGSCSASALSNYLQANGYSYFRAAALDAIFGNSAINDHGGTGPLNSHNKPEVAVIDGSVDEQMLIGQYGDRISILHFAENQFCGEDRYQTNAMYQNYLLKFGLEPW
ncbi:MAG: hypothetical protein AWM53_00625 [Candidatus Dichloromethanomonas elyunquensis]|nr:MAG: hypothetical protein AWM53_00625 [Candidatus Dichloromethanomonas elyunquensis]